MEPERRKLIITLVVVLLAAASISIMNSTAENYLEVVKATQGMEADLMNLEIEENTVFMTFRFNNESSLDIALINVQFNLYANTEYVGNFDMRKRTILNTGDNDVIVEAEIYPRYIQELTGSEDETLESFLLSKSGEIQWFLYGAAVIELPFGEDTINVQIRKQWVST
jgi:hypothetical protein